MDVLLSIYMLEDCEWPCDRDTVHKKPNENSSYLSYWNVKIYSK